MELYKRGKAIANKHLNLDGSFRGVATQSPANQDNPY
jgi:hypothetical protein